MKKTILLVLIFSAAVSSVYAGGSRAGASSGGGAEAPREISLCMSQIRWGISVDEAMIREWVAVIERATNTKIEIVAPTHNDYEDKLSVLLASGDYPDIIRPFRSQETVPQFALRGYLQPVTSIINSDPRFAPAKETDLSIYSANNEVYGLPTGGGGNTKIIWFRKDLVDKYGLNIKETMTTNEFVTELRKVNKNEAIPFSFPKHIINFQIFYNFFKAYGGILPDSSGRYYDGIQTDEMKQAFLWVKSLYDEGLMDREFITNENANMREKLASGKAVSNIDYAGRYSFYRQSAQDVGAPTDFLPVYTLIGPNGGQGNLNESGNEAMCLSVTNKNVDVSLDVIHYIFYTREGRKIDALGVEGVHYDIVNRVLVPRPAAVTAGYTPSYISMSGGFSPVPFSEFGFSFQGISDEVLEKTLTYNDTALSAKYLGPLIKIQLGQSSLYDENVASYTANLYEMATKIVLGSQTIDAAYADYARFWRSMNGDEMLRQLNGGR